MAPFESLRNDLRPRRGTPNVPNYGSATLCTAEGLDTVTVDLAIEFDVDEATLQDDVESKDAGSARNPIVR